MWRSIEVALRCSSQNAHAALNLRQPTSMVVLLSTNNLWVDTASGLRQREASNGSAYSANGQLAEAAAEFQRALAVEPYIPAYNGLGLVAVKQHDFVAARKNFERAIQIDPKDAESQLNLGVLCMQTGDAPCGRTAFHAFLANASPVQYRDMIPRVQYALRTVLAQKP